MDVETHTVAGGVFEVLTHAPIGDHASTHVIDGPGHHSGLDRGHTSQLRGRDEVEDLLEGTGRSAAHAERAGHVRAVAVKGGTEVHHHRVARDDGAVAWMVMRLCRVLSCGNDCLEGHGLRPAPAHR